VIGLVPPQTAVSISISAASVKFEKSIEIVATVLLACATVGSARSAYQAKRWGGVQMFRMIAANGARSEAMRLSDKTSCAVGAPPCMKMGSASSRSVNCLFSVGVGPFS